MKKLYLFLLLKLFFNINCTEEYLDLTQRNTYDGVTICSWDSNLLMFLDKEIQSQKIRWRKAGNIKKMSFNNKIIYYLDYLVHNLSAPAGLTFKEIHDQLHKVDYLKFAFKFLLWS